MCSVASAPGAAGVWFWQIMSGRWGPGATDGATAPPEGAHVVYALVAFLTRKPDLTVEEFQRHWLELHGPVVAALPGLRRYVQSHTRRSAYAAGRFSAYDGVALTSFDSTDAVRGVAAALEYTRVLANTASFLAPGGIPSILTREHVIVA